MTVPRSSSGVGLRSVPPPMFAPPLVFVLVVVDVAVVVGVVLVVVSVPVVVAVVIFLRKKMEARFSNKNNFFKTKNGRICCFFFLKEENQTSSRWRCDASGSNPTNVTSTTASCKALSLRKTS